MTVQQVSGATAVVFALGVVMVGPVNAQQRRDGSLLPQEESGQVTAVGCLVRGSTIKGGKDKYVLARVKKGPVASVPEATCTADPGADALQLDNPEKASMTDAMLGKWVQIGGRLEKETSKDPDNLRELDVLTLKMVPVVPPRPAAAPAAAAPPAMAEPRPRPRRGGTRCTGTGCPCTGTRRAQEASEDRQPGSGARMGRVALARSRPRSSFVPAAAAARLR